MLALWRALVLLYESAGQPAKSLEILIGLKDPSVFSLLRRHLLAEEPSGSGSSSSSSGGGGGGAFGLLVRKRFLPLCQIDNSKAVALMIDCMRELPVGPLSPVSSMAFFSLINLSSPSLVCLG